MISGVIKFFLKNRLITFLLLILFISWGLVVSPFNWNLSFLPRDRVPVDAIPDIGENQQVIFTQWMGKSPADIENQITYPLTSNLLGMQGVKTIRSNSMFGLSVIYVIFKEKVDYYTSRIRILEKLNTIPPNLLPTDVKPKIGPDATALGQVYWYTLEGRDKEGQEIGGWDLHELRSIQDYYVKYGLSSIEGVSEVASIGGHTKQYQVDLNPELMKLYGISIMNVIEALKNNNKDTGASTIEVNQVEYFIRGLGLIKSIEDIENIPLKLNNNTPFKIKHIARVKVGAEERNMKGILDKGGREAVGGIVLARYGENPLEVIENIKNKIKEISVGLPERTLDDGRISKVEIVPYYDRSVLIEETLETLGSFILFQIIITVIVIIILIQNLQVSLLVCLILPISVLMCFIFMKYMGVDANIVSLSGIAIAIGTMVDLGIILSESILKKIQKYPNKALLNAIYEASSEVTPAIMTALSTTIVSFFPVFILEGAEGKLFSPLAWTKTFALISAFLFIIILMPSLFYWVFSVKKINLFSQPKIKLIFIGLSTILAFFFNFFLGIVLASVFINELLYFYCFIRHKKYYLSSLVGICFVFLSWLLAKYWMPLGFEASVVKNFFFIFLVIALVLGSFLGFIKYYPSILMWALKNKKKFLAIPLFIIVFSFLNWQGFEKVFNFPLLAFQKLGLELKNTSIYKSLNQSFPGMQKEFMPSLDEGSFLLMPTSSVHSGVEFNKETLSKIDALVGAIEEVDLVVGKAGRAETAIDSAPLSMFENLIFYKPEYKLDQNGKRLKFKINNQGNFVRDTQNKLIEDQKGSYYRQWRSHIKSKEDIWREIQSVAKIPGITPSSKLQPIETRLVMLQTGMRAPIGIKIYGPNLDAIENFGINLEKLLKEEASLSSDGIYFDRALGKPYLEINWDREAIAKYGFTIEDLQMYIEVALGGMPLSYTLEGKEKYAIRARYAKEFREDPEAIKNMPIVAPNGSQMKLKKIANISYKTGPSMINGENAFLVGYLLLNKRDGVSEVTAVENSKKFIESKIKSGVLKVPSGTSFKFSGTYENQIRAEKKLALVIPLALGVIFLILYFQFRSVSLSLFIFSAIMMALSGGFLLLWLYSKEWFMNFSFFGSQLREIFQIRNFDLSVAVWVGFIALFGIATDDGVMMATALKEGFKNKKISSKEEIRKMVLAAGLERLRPCLMTTATTLLALLPVLSSLGRGSDIMIPMAIPAFGGMLVALITLLMIPVLYSFSREIKLKK